MEPGDLPEWGVGQADRPELTVLHTFPDWRWFARGGGPPLDSAQLAEGRADVRRPHEGLADEHRPHAAALQPQDVVPRADAALAYQAAPSRQLRRQFQRVPQPRDERPQVAVVDADQPGP